MHGSPPGNLFDKITDYLDKKGAERGYEKRIWQRYRSSLCPTQENGYDCGIFICLFGERLSRGLRDLDFDFTQSDINYFRKRIVCEIIEGRINDE